MTAEEHAQYRRTGRLPARFQYSASHNAYVETTPANGQKGQVAIPRWMYYVRQLSGGLSSFGPSSQSGDGESSSWPSLPSFGDGSSWPSLPSFGDGSSWPAMPSFGDRSSWPAMPSLGSLNGALSGFMGGGGGKPQDADGGGGGGGKPQDADGGGGDGQEADGNAKETTVEQNGDEEFLDALPDLEVPTMYDIAKDVVQSDAAKDIIKMAIGFMPGGAPALRAYEAGSKIMNANPKLKIPGFK